MSDASLTDRARMMRLIDGFVTTQLVYAVTKLGIAEALDDGPKSAAELAAATGSHPGRLHRVMRDLAVQDVFDELGDGRFALTGLGRQLVSLRALAVIRAGPYYAAAAHILDALLGDEVPFEAAHGERFFDYMTLHPETEAIFQTSMAERSTQEVADVVAAYDFAQFERIVDVGGGRGLLLAAILESAPSLRGVLFDREAAIPAAERSLHDAGLSERVECSGGDFFTHVPAGADAYVFSRILHDWEDEDAERILRSCHRSMRPESRLLVVDAVLPDKAKDSPLATRMDIFMLMFGARERSEAEFRQLFERSGFVFEGVVMTQSPANLGVVQGRPA